MNNSSTNVKHFKITTPLERKYERKFSPSSLATLSLPLSSTSSSYNPIVKDWNFINIEDVNHVLDQESRVRQMMRTKTLQLQLETEINMWHVRNDQKKPDHLKNKEENVKQKVQYLMDNQRELYNMLHQQDRKDREKLNKSILIRNVVSLISDKFTEICKWRACSNIHSKRILNHTKQQQSILINGCEKMTKQTIQLYENKVKDKLVGIEKHLKIIRNMIQTAKDHHLNSVESLVSKALNSRNDYSLSHLTSTLSIFPIPPPPPPPSPVEGRKGNSSVNGEDGGNVPLSFESKAAEKETSDFQVSDQDIGKIVWVNKVGCWG
jgi:hypothetical protein